MAATCARQAPASDTVFVIATTHRLTDSPTSDACGSSLMTELANCLGHRCHACLPPCLYAYFSVRVPVSYWHRWITAPPKERHGRGESAVSTRGSLSVLFVVLDVWLLIVQVRAGVGRACVACNPCALLSVPLPSPNAPLE